MANRGVRDTIAAKPNYLICMSPDPQPLPSPGAAAGLLADVLRPGDDGSEAPGDVIGVYRLMEKLGEGGFGVVWRAEQTEPIRREVALKIIKLGMDTLEVMRRFEQERQALALMDHPNIASVFNAGATPEGRPFFVMELVRGVPVTQYCIEKALPLEARLSLFKEVCSGVQHAHQKGVIHRDLKPSNVIVTEVDGVPVPKIIDFGIAKATTTDSLMALTLVTRVDQMMGTPLYMSPEQAAASADIDTRSDVYALGVLLYELLTGQPPFDAETLMKAGMDEMRRIIREVEPKPPSRRNDEARLTTDETQQRAAFRHSRDLDLITLRALEKDRTRRYESASALGEDIQRFLNHEPVQARAPSMAYVAQRWVRRHRVVAMAALVCLLAVVGGAGVALWQAQEARRQAREADAALGVALEVLSSTVELDKGRLIQLKAMMDHASEKARLLSASPERMMELHMVLGKAYRSLFAPKEAVRELRLALAAAERCQVEPKVLLDLHHSLATALLEVEDFKAALPMARLALQEVESIKGPNTYGAALMLSVIGRSLAGEGQPQEGLAAFEDMLQRLAHGDSLKSSTVVLAARRFYPQALRDAGRIDDGLEAGRENIRIAQAGTGPKSIDYAMAQDYHARECEKAERWQEAHDEWKSSLEIYITAYGPSNTRSSGAADGLVRMKLKLGLNDEAVSARRRFLGLVESAAGARSLEASKQAKLLIGDLRSLGRIAEAKNEITQRLQMLKTTKGTYPVSAEPILTAAVEVYEGAEEWQAALDAQRAAMIIRKSYLPNAFALDYSKVLEGHYLAQMKRFDEALPLMREGIAALEQTKAKDSSIESKWLPMAREKLKAAETAAGK